MAFQFRLAALLKYREKLRDQCRQVLAQWLQRDADLTVEQQILETERELQLAEMLSEQTSTAAIQVDRLASRRYRAGQLSAELSVLAERRRELAGQIALCRQALVKADQGVKVLEQFSDRQRAEFQAAQEKHEAREREEAWQAGQWLEV